MIQDRAHESCRRNGFWEYAGYTHIEIKQQVDQCVRKNRKISTHEEASEMSTIKRDKWCKNGFVLKRKYVFSHGIMKDVYLETKFFDLHGENVGK